MKFAILQFPGSNCDQDCLRLCRDGAGIEAEYVWHGDDSLDGFDAVIVSGGFSYGDYLRCGAIARFSPVMRAVERAAAEGRLILGICNGFQILCETGLLPGALIRNRGLRFVCARQHLRVETGDSPFTNQFTIGEVIQLPVAHGEGCYVAEEATLAQLKEEDRILVRYCDTEGRAGSNPNGSLEAIAGICNQGRNVFGLMPHPDRAFEPRLGGTDGLRVITSMLHWLNPQQAPQPFPQRKPQSAAA